MKPHNIQEGDKVLLGRKQSKLDSPYDPLPYTVTQVHGTQIVARRGDQQKTRDSQYWKKVDTRQRKDFTAIRERGFRRKDDYLPDIGPAAAAQPPGEPETITADPPAHQGVQQAYRTPARQPREKWILQAPSTWVPTRSRPLTRSVQARRQADRERAMGREAVTREGPR